MDGPTKYEGRVEYYSRYVHMHLLYIHMNIFSLIEGETDRGRVYPLISGATTLQKLCASIWDMDMP